MVYYTLVIETLGLIVSIFGYLHERNKREKIELAYTEINTKLKITQQNTQQVNTNLQNVNTIVNKASLSQEDIKNLAKEIAFATSTTKNTTIALDLIPEEIRLAVWRRDDGKCVKCGTRENLEYGHIIPTSKGGSNSVRNIELLCKKCNTKKRDNIG